MGRGSPPQTTRLPLSAPPPLPKRTSSGSTSHQDHSPSSQLADRPGSTKATSSSHHGTMPSGTLAAPSISTAGKSGRRPRTASSASAASSSTEARVTSTPVTPKIPSSVSTSQSRQESREPWGNPPPMASASRSTSVSASAVTPGPPSERTRSTEEDEEEVKKRWEARQQAFSQLALTVCQQPERARLCSFKEENETIDRRPVDPPPVVELITRNGEYPDMLDSTQFFIRASLVAVEPTATEDGKPSYPTIKTPTGADATAGDVMQTPERLRHLDGTPGALCIFAKLSVRLPGTFRLKFTLYETGQDGLSEITDTVSEPFEVFSPKLFKGMHESTPLTRHLATQGLKVKLRQDPQGSKGNKRRASSNSQASRQHQQRSPGSDMLSPGPRSAPAQPSSLRYSQSSGPLPSAPTSAPPYPSQPGLGWHGHYPSYPGYPEYESAGPSSSRRSPPYPADEGRPRKVRRSVGHDEIYARQDISSRLDLSLPSPSSDLSAFSLGARRPQSSSSAPPSSRHEPRHEWVRRDYPPGDDSLPHLVLSPPPPQHYPSRERAPPPPQPAAAPQEFAYPRLPRIVPSTSSQYPPAHHRHHDVPPPHHELQHHAPPSQHYSHSQPASHSHSHHYSHQSQHRSSSPYSRHPRALGYPPAPHYHHAAPQPLPAQYRPGSPPPVLPPIRHSRSRSPSVPHRYDRDPRA